ncbi:MAG: hypothetical protein L0H53_00990, partial [Candidatus Nitrosocosmicus sp.]|nr:hypothetical protein [Candidatus Nitrosocosmicus sp.]
MNFLYAILPQITTGIIVGVVVFLITRYKIDPELAKRDKKKKHQEEIFGIYEKWLESPFSYKVDLTDFNLDKLNIAFKESFPTRLINQVEVPQSVEEQALYHLYQE